MDTTFPLSHKQRLVMMTPINLGDLAYTATDRW
jgi:hypothetical protein